MQINKTRSLLYINIYNTYIIIIHGGEIKNKKKSVEVKSTESLVKPSSCLKKSLIKDLVPFEVLLVGGGGAVQNLIIKIQYRFSKQFHSS